MKRRSAVVAFGMVLVGALAASEVSAATAVKTSVTILDANGERFTGRVTSPKQACVKGRKITLYIYTATSGRRNYAGYPGYEVVGKATTNANGNWEVKASEAFLEGDYRASVARKKVSSGGDTFLCMARWGPPKHA